MRILLTTDVVGGVWGYTLTLVRELVGRGHSCAVAVIGDPSEDRLHSLPDGVEVFQRDFRLEWLPGGLEDVEPATAWLVETAAEWGADVVHLNQFAYGTGDFSAPVLVVAHSDVLSWLEEVRGVQDPEEWAQYRAAIRRGLLGADGIVAPTSYQAERVTRHYGASPVRVIHNGIRPPALDPEIPPASGRPLVLVAGRGWDAAKGIEILDRALEAMGDAAPSVHMVGPLGGPAGERLEVSRLVIHGEVDPATMERFYGNTRLYVSPSIYEPFGLCPLEAAGHGCGLLLSGIGSFRELWTGAADFFEPLRPDVLAQSLAAALADPDRLDERAGQAVKRARERYSAERMTDQYESLYRELSARAPGIETLAS